MKVIKKYVVLAFSIVWAKDANVLFSLTKNIIVEVFKRNYREVLLNTIALVIIFIIFIAAVDYIRDFFWEEEWYRNIR